MPLIFGREPALLLGLLQAALLAGVTFGLDLTAGQQGVITALASAGVGLWVASKVERDKLVPKVLGFVQSFVALAVAFGWDATPETQGVVMTLAAAVVAMYTRTQVTASVDEDGVEVGKHAA